MLVLEHESSQGYKTVLVIIIFLAVYQTDFKKPISLNNAFGKIKGINMH